MVKINAYQLPQQLQKTLAPCYVLCGNEPLLLNESLDAICACASKQHYQERFHFILDNQTDWQDIALTCQEIGLFAHRRIVILDSNDHTINTAINTHLTELITQLTPDTLLILQCPRLTKTQEKLACFNLQPQLVMVQCDTPDAQQLPNWLNARAKQMNIHLDPQALQLLCYCYEGNLLALKQTLDLLSLLYPDGKLTLARIEKKVNDEARFAPYQWIDALLIGKAPRALHVLQQLEHEGAESLLLVRILQRELLSLLQLKRDSQHTPLITLFNQQKIWQFRRSLLTHALERLTMLQLHYAIQRLTEIEIAIKQDFSESIWPALQDLSLQLCGLPALSPFTSNGD